MRFWGNCAISSSGCCWGWPPLRCCICSGSGSVRAAGMAGLVAGAMSMAAGEYVSVSSQSDTERADLERERKELASDHEHEHRELAAIYVSRGLEPALAHKVAEQLMAKDAL